MEKHEISVAEYLQRIDERQQGIEKLLLSQKTALTFDEGAIYTGLGKSHLYKLTSGRIIPFFKPRGKMIYFDRAELDNWLLQNRIATAEEIEAQAQTYSATKTMGRAAK